MRNVLRAVMAAVAVVACTTAASAAPILPSSTGLGPGNILLPINSPDTDWLLVVEPGASAIPLGTPGFRYFNGAYVPDSASSGWLSPAVGGNAGASGYYTYQTTFDLTGYDPMTAVLAGLFSTDNDGSIALNGVTIGSSGFAGFGALTPFTVSTGFVAGVNLFTVTANNGGDPTAFRVQFDRLDAREIPTTPVPEPASLTLLGCGLAGLAERRRRQRAAAQL